MKAPQRSALDPSLEDMRAMGAAVVDFAAQFVDDRYTAPASDYAGLQPLLDLLGGPPPDHGQPLQELLALVETASGKGLDTAGAGFMGYIPGGGLYAAALGDFVADVVNRYTGVSGPAPALVHLEATVLRWLCDLFDLPGDARGILTTGGSMSTLSAVVAARTSKLGERFLDGTLYVSAEVHHCVDKAARIAGLPREAVRVVPTDPALRLDLAELRRMVQEDRSSGRRPFLVVATAGTIGTGVVDPISQIADVAEEEDLWLHVDAAYGGFFQLTERGRQTMRGIERADTITLDPHKSLFLPWGTGCLLARDGAVLRQAHDADAGYLPEQSDDPAMPDFSAYSPELTRDFRGLRLWLPLHLHGVAAFTQALDEKLDLAGEVYAALSALPELEVLGPPDLSLLAFRLRQGTDEDNTRLLEAINASGRVLLSAAPIRGVTYLRVCILSHRTRPDRVRELVDIVKASACEHGSQRVDPAAH